MANKFLRSAIEYALVLILFFVFIFALTGFFLPQQSKLQGNATAILRVAVEDDGDAHTVITRVGSGPGWYDETFVLDFHSNNMSLRDDPGLRSETAVEVRPGVFRDAFYWPTTFSLQDASIDPTGNRIGLGPRSDIFEQFYYYEVCPRHGFVVLHKDSDPTNVHMHVCGRGGGAIALAHCPDVTARGCVFRANISQPDLELGFFDVSQEKQTCTKVYVHNNASADTRFSGTRTRNALVVDGVINLFDMQWYAVFDGNTTTVYEEHVPRHTHTWQAFVALELHLILYTHFISDSYKDMGCRWTRFPILFGACIAFLTTVLVHTEIAVQERLYVLDAWFRYTGAGLVWAATVVSGLNAAGAFGIAAVLPTVEENLSHVLKYHLTILYEMALCLPLTLLLSGGGRYNLLSLVFLFTLTVVTIGTRVRDFVRFMKNPKSLDYYRNKGGPGWYASVFLFALEAVTVFVYASIVLPGVWKTSFHEAFLFAAVDEWATFYFTIIFIFYVGYYASRHETYYALEPGRGEDVTPCGAPKTGTPVPKPVQKRITTARRVRLKFT